MRLSSARVASNMIRTKLLATTASASRAVKTCAQADQPRSGRHRPHLQRHRTQQGDRPIPSSTVAASTAATAAPCVDMEADHEYNPHPALQVLSRYRALVLDSAYRPIDVVNWQRAICMDLMEKADVLEYYNATISSVSEQWFLPAVLRARWYGGSMGRFGRVVLNRRNIILRDKLTCQYCGKSGGALTLDHVIPQSKGGGNTWTNLVTACPPCNAKKGDKTLKQLKWKLRQEPREPSPWELNLVLAAVGALDAKQLPQEWSGYLFTNSEKGA